MRLFILGKIFCHTSSPRSVGTLVTTYSISDRGHVTFSISIANPLEDSCNISDIANGYLLGDMSGVWDIAGSTGKTPSIGVILGWVTAEPKS